MMRKSSDKETPIIHTKPMQIDFFKVDDGIKKSA